jgi:hypothetical protein
MISSGALSVDLYPWLKGNKGIEALAGIKGFGWPDVVNRWFEGAGDGAVFRGSRTLPRDIDLPLTAEADDRAGLLSMLSTLALILDPYDGTARIDFMLPDGELWFVDVVREGGGDWDRMKDTDNDKYINTVVSLRAGDPFWTRTRPDQFTVRQDASGRGLMPYIAKLEVSSSGAFGIRDVVNIGDARAWPFWTLKGPFTSFTFVGPKGETIAWSGSILVGNGIYIDTKNGTLKDFNGVNKYDGLASAPKFWSIAPGTAVVSATMLGTSAVSEAKAEWSPRRWLVA